MVDLSKINDAVWNMGEQRAEIIAPLAQSKICTREMVLEAANKLKLSTHHVYKLIHNYRQSNGLLTSIVPHKPDGSKEDQDYLSRKKNLLIKL